MPRCINDTIIHLATSEMGFGGFGESGMGSYHGKDGFHTFSHYKSIVDKKTWLDLPMRYQPYRKIYEKLINWKNNGMKKPLMIIGARQVGKTYIINEFCKKEYKNAIQINLLNHPEIVELYKQNISLEEKYIRLCANLNINPNLEDTIIFFDEIQESEELISSLKWYCEDERPFKIICAGSLLGVKLKRFHSSFPVGKVEMINMFPMDFEEFNDTK